MSKEPLMAFDYNPALGRYGFPIPRDNITRIPATSKDRTMPHTPRIALDDALEPGQGIGAGMASKLMSYLETVLSGDQVADVKAIMDGQGVETPSVALDRAMKRHADNVKRRQAGGASLNERFPNMNRLAR